MFSEYGIPKLIVTNNGRPFVSTEFDDFLARNGVQHLRTPPWHPASNGLVERLVQSWKCVLRKFPEGDIHARMARGLWALRTAPSGKGGRTPAELLGRQFRTHLTQMHPDNLTKNPLASTTLTPAHSVGECVWVLKHSINAKRGFLESL